MISRTRRHELLVLGLSIAFGLGLVEVGLRLYAALTDTHPAAQLRQTRTSFPPPFDGNCADREPTPLGLLIRPSDYPELIYEMKPDLDTCHTGVRLQTNADGIRAPRRYVRPKPDDVFRILLLGDSQTYGWGVTHEETFGNLLATELSNAARSTRVEVVNAGVSGYNTVQEAAYLRAAGMEYEPDCVVVLFIANDLDLPEFLLDGKYRAGFGRSYLLGTLSMLADRFLLGAAPIDPLRSPSKMERIPDDYRHMAGMGAYRRALRDIRETAGDADVVNFADYPAGEEWETIVRFQRRLGIVVPEFEFPWAAEYWLSDSDRHLNPAGHAELSLRILEGFEQHGVCRPPEP